MFSSKFLDGHSHVIELVFPSPQDVVAKHNDPCLLVTTMHYRSDHATNMQRIGVQPIGNDERDVTESNPHDVGEGKQVSSGQTVCRTSIMTGHCTSGSAQHFRFSLALQMFSIRRLSSAIVKQISQNV